MQGYPLRVKEVVPPYRGSPESLRRITSAILLPCIGSLRNHLFRPEWIRTPFYRLFPLS
jgi:hypothetical protein